MYLEKKIELPKNEEGNYTLTKEAVKIIQKAESIVARWNKHRPELCFLRACVKSKFEGEQVDIHYDMPINIIGNYASMAFVGHFSIYRHKGLPAWFSVIKEGSVMGFGADTGGSQNTDNAGLVWDRVNYYIENWNKGKKIRYFGLLDESLTPAHSCARLTYEH